MEAVPLVPASTDYVDGNRTHRVNGIRGLIRYLYSHNKLHGTYIHSPSTEIDVQVEK